MCERALDDLAGKGEMPTHIIVDGTLFRPWRGVPHQCIPKADSLYPCVSAASILAKTERDGQVERMCDQDADLDVKYGIRSNKGYLSAKHVQGIREHGYTPFHRRSYRIRALEEA